MCTHRRFRWNILVARRSPTGISDFGHFADAHRLERADEVADVGGDDQPASCYFGLDDLRGDFQRSATKRIASVISPCAGETLWMRASIVDSLRRY